MRFTKIVATIGPATCTVEGIEALAKAGVSVCRLNFSHGSHAMHGKTIDAIKAVNKKFAKNEKSHQPPLGILLDTKGPMVRTGDVMKPIQIKKGDRVLFTSKKAGRNPRLKSGATIVPVDYDHLAHDVRSARCIFIDNGLIEFTVESIEKNGTVIAIAQEDGSIGSRRQVNLPGARISLPSFTDRDWADIRFGIGQGVDFFGTSFVRTGSDIELLRKFLQKHGSTAEIIAKIETPQAVDNLDEIIEASDGVMVARGDLGAEVPFELVPQIQQRIVSRCRAKGKHVIVATQMLETMIHNSMPTRAEVTDIAFAGAQQTDATMLSGETAVGIYPLKSVETMHRILVANERITPSFLTSEPCATPLDMPRSEQALAASVLATKLDAAAIVVISRHGVTAKAVSSCRPLIPIHAFVEDVSCVRRLMLVWGIVPHDIAFSQNTEKTLERALTLLRKENDIKKGSRIVIVSDMQAGTTPVMTIQIRTMG